jgi:DNA polymerase/3'-5' exonuclease PolX
MSKDREITYKEGKSLARKILFGVYNSYDFGLEPFEIAGTAIKLRTKVVVAGSMRRHKTLIGDLDFVVIDDHRLFKRFKNVLDKVINDGDLKISGYYNGFPVDVNYVEKRNFGTSILHFTGPSTFNIKLRARAKKLGYKLSQNGIENLSNGEIYRFKTEQKVFKFLNLKYIKPILRDKNISITI